MEFSKLKYDQLVEKASKDVEEIGPIEDVDELENGADNETSIIAKAKEAVQKIEKSLPKIQYIELPPDKEIVYKQKYIPQCRLCKHPLREEAETAFVRYNMVPNRVVEWFKSKGYTFTWECVANHMNKHCEWDSPLINFPERVIARQDEIAAIKNDRIQWNLDALTIANLDLLSQIEAVKNDVDSVRIYNAVCNGIKIQAQLMKLQHDTMGSQEQAKSMIENNNRKLVALLEKILNEVDGQQKIKILELIREFQIGDDN